MGNIAGRMWFALVCPVIATRQVEHLRKPGCDLFTSRPNQAVMVFSTFLPITHTLGVNGKNIYLGEIIY